MNAELLDRLLKAGTPTALVAEVAAELARADVAQDLIEKRRAKDRARKSVPRNSTDSVESAENAEFHNKGSLEVSPENPLPKPSKSTPFNPPKKDRFPAPDGVTDEQWKAFGKQRKKPWSDHSYKLVCNKLASLVAEGHDAGKLVDLAVENNWETVWPPKQARDPPAKSKYVSKSGYEYRGSIDDIIRESERRGDMDTHWKAKGDRSRKVQSIGELVGRHV